VVESSSFWGAPEGESLVAVIADDAAPGPGGPQFAGAGVAAPTALPGMPEVNGKQQAEPGAAPGVFRAAWELPEQVKARKAQRRRRNRKWAKRVGIVAVVCAVGVVASPRVHTLIVARSVAPDLRAYVEGKGVTHAPVAEGYSVRFPKEPTVSAPPVVAASIALPIVTHSSVAVGSDYRIVVWDADLPRGVLPKGAVGALKDPKIGGSGTLAAVHSLRIAGETAYVGTFTSSDALPRRVAVIVHGGRLFVIRAQAESAGAVFDTVVQSFQFTR
jgi:hypothetical protein